MILRIKFMLGLSILWSFCAVAAVAQDIVLAADQWCPFNCKPGSENPGILIEIAQRAFKNSKYNVPGINFVYKDMPWARAIEEARKGQVDGIVGASKDDAPDFIFPETSIILTENKFYTLTESPLTSLDIKSLEGVTLGAIRDYAYVDELNLYIKNNLKNPKKIQLSSGEDPLGINIRKLLAKRLDVLVEDVSVMNYTLHTLNMKNKFKVLNSNLKSDKLYIAFSPQGIRSKELADLVNAEMKRLEHSAELKELLSKYGM